MINELGLGVMGFGLTSLELEAHRCTSNAVIVGHPQRKQAKTRFTVLQVHTSQEQQHTCHQKPQTRDARPIFLDTSAVSSKAMSILLDTLSLKGQARHSPFIRLFNPSEQDEHWVCKNRAADHHYLKGARTQALKWGVTLQTARLRF